MKTFDPISLALLMGALSLIPLLIVSCTAFLKVSVVILILRNVLGVQQVPSNLSVYGISLVMAAFVMMPTLRQMQNEWGSGDITNESVSRLVERSGRAIEPLKTFMIRFSRPDQLTSFYQSAKRASEKEDVSPPQKHDLMVVMPAFIISELTSAFEIGFVLALPFVVIDLVVSNILMALGMMMMSPATISLPLKMLLFISVDGWGRLFQGLAVGYTL